MFASAVRSARFDSSSVSASDGRSPRPSSVPQGPLEIGSVVETSSTGAGPIEAEPPESASQSSRVFPSYGLNPSGTNDGLIRTPRLETGGVSPLSEQLSSPEDYRRLADDPERPGATTIVTLGVDTDENDLDEAMADLAEQENVGPILGLISGTRNHEIPLYDEFETGLHMLGWSEIPTVRNAGVILRQTPRPRFT